MLSLVFAFDKQQGVAFRQIFPNTVGLYNVKADILPIKSRGSGALEIFSIDAIGSPKQRRKLIFCDGFTGEVS